MNDNKGIIETIVEVLRKANLGFSVNEVKDIFFDQKKSDKEEKEDEKKCSDPKKQ